MSMSTVGYLGKSVHRTLVNNHLPKHGNLFIILNILVLFLSDQSS